MLNINNMENILYPYIRKINDVGIVEDIIGIRPDETMEEAVNRHLLEKRVKKIKKIQDRMKKQINH